MKDYSKITTDIEAIKRRYKQLDGQVNTRDTLWKPDPTKKTTIRILPYQMKGMPFIETRWHYNLNGKHYLSPMTIDEYDPIVERAREFLKSGTDEDKEVFKTLMPTQRTYVPIIVRGEEDLGVRFWGFGIRTYKLLASLFEENGDFINPINGHDLVVDYKPADKAAGRRFPETTVVPVMKVNSVSDDEEYLEKVIENQPNLVGDIFQVASAEELEEAFNAQFGDDDEEVKEKAGKTAPTPDEEEVSVSNAVSRFKAKMDKK